MKKTKTDSENSSQSKTSKGANAQTMEELLSSQTTKFVPFKRGDKVKAKILKIGKREVLCDIGGKSFGLVVGKEFDLIKDLLGNFKVGDVVDSEVIIPEMEGGETLVSLKKKAVGKLWNNLFEIKDQSREIKVEGLKAVSGGLLVDCFGLRGFIPQAQLDPDFSDSPDKLTGEKIPVKILEINQAQNRLVLSQKEVTQKEELEAKRKSVSYYKSGEKVKGKVVDMDKYSLYVEVEKEGEKAVGVIHISELSWERVDDISSLFSVGDEIAAEIINVDMQEGQINLSLKQLQKDPWEGIEKTYKPEKNVKGTVVKTSGIGVFVELEKGIEGLLHVSKIPPGKEFKVGEKIPVTIEKVDSKKRKISLSYVSSTKPIGYR